jgi:hypothetical protein
MINCLSLRRFIERPEYIFFVLVFLVNPLFGVLVAFSYIVLKDSGHGQALETGLIVLFCVFISAFLGLINSTKVPENDLVWYLEGYYAAGSFDFFDYVNGFGINGQGVEIAFPVFNYIVYSFLGNNGAGYVFFVTFIYYFFISYSVFRFGCANKISSSVVVFSILCFSLAPNIFSTSAVILRQNIASALIVYVFIEAIFFKRYRYFFIFLVPFVHASGVFFMALLFVPGLKNKISYNNIHWYVFAVVLLFGYQYMASVLASLFPGDGLIGYVLNRASLGTSYDLPPLSVFKIVFDVLLVLISFCVTYFYHGSRFDGMGLAWFSNVLAAICLFVLSNLNYVELSVRFNFYYLGFFPFVVALVLGVLGKKTNFILALFLQFPLVLLFYSSLYDSPWAYGVKDGMFYLPIFYYFSS